ncbi:MAG: hypothetical protein ACOX0B_00925 [Minisyncoccales bacterium]|jgi:hypothetical protein|nr:hypothetical protein [Candidatus Paceibacterota bacterium]
MRKVLTFSVSETENKKFNKKMKEKGFSSKSDYFKYLLTIDDNLTSEEELLEIITKGDKAYGEGRCMPIETLKDLL